jgi:hypothetical protein
MRRQFQVNSLDILAQPIRTIWNPVTVAPPQFDVHLSRRLPRIRLRLDLPMQIPQKSLFPVNISAPPASPCPGKT